MLVDEAVSLSVSWGVPKMLIGATIVSLGTTLPETAVSVLAAVQGSPGLAGVPYLHLSGIFTEGGRLRQIVGLVFLVLLGLYIWRSIRWSRNAPIGDIGPATVDVHGDVKPVRSLIKLAVGIALVVLSSQVLILTVEETALRLSIPDAIIAATLVAFGTSLPELALGNVIGADVVLP